MIHLYGIVEGLTELPACGGLDGAHLERRRIGRLEVVVSRAESDATNPSEERVLVHARVVDELIGRSEALLPAQFGHAFGSDEELVRAVQTSAPELERRLSSVRGCVEFGLRVFPVQAESRDKRARSGHDYMRLRLEEVNERRRVSDELHEPLAQLARASTRPDGASQTAFSAAYLVPDANVEAFRERARRLMDAHSERRLVFTGPWPPYSFAGIQGRDA
jgi:hypothetical protein